MTFHLLFVHIILVRFRLLSGHLLGKSCSLDCPYVLFVFLFFVILVISRFGFEGGIWVLIAPVCGHCILVTFILVTRKQRRVIALDPKQQNAAYVG